MSFELGKSYRVKKEFCGINVGCVLELVATNCHFVYGFRNSDGVVYNLHIEETPVYFYETPVEQDHSVTSKTTAESFLLRAAQLQKERGEQYDSPEGERSMGKAVTAFNTITGQNISESEGWLLLQLLKDVRQWSKNDYHADSAEDCIAYAALKAESLSSGK